MSELFGRVTPKFAHVLTRLPQFTPADFGVLQGGELLAVRIGGEWTVLSEDDPSKLDPRLETIYLSSGRDKGEAGLAFEATDRLSRALYDTQSDLPEKLRGAVLVAATWYFPEWDWYINQPILEIGSPVGFPTTEGMWGTISGDEHEAQGFVVVCASGSVRESKERQLRIRKGGWPRPKEWSPRGRLPGDY